MTDEERRPSVGFAQVRLWLALFVVGCAAQVVTALALGQRLAWPPSLYGPVIFATGWTGLAIGSQLYNSHQRRS